MGFGALSHGRRVVISPLLRGAVEAASADGDEDLKENVLQTYEAFVLRCPKDVSAAELDAIVQIALNLLSFDPNFAGDDEDGSGGGSGSESGNESFGSDDEDDNVEEDDESWKVCSTVCAFLDPLTSPPFFFLGAPRRRQGAVGRHQRAPRAAGHHAVDARGAGGAEALR